MDLAFALALATLTGTRSYAQSPQTQRWIVTFKTHVKAAGREAALAELGVSAAAHIASEGDSDAEFSAAVVELPAGKSLARSEADAASGGDIVSVELDRRWKWIERSGANPQSTSLTGEEFPQIKVSPEARFPEPMLGAALSARAETTWGINRVHAPSAWDITEGADVKVAVIDTGIDLAHPDLSGKIDGGYSAISKTENPADYQDDNGHGTHVSGIIAAQRDGKGVVGVAPRARLYSVKVLDADGSGQISNVIDGIIWAGKNGMQVANLSLGIPEDSPALHQAVRFAQAKGVVLVAASGNSGGAVEFPGAYAEIIAVGASDSKDRRAEFSGHGREVQFIAPGVDVVSDKLGGGLTAMSGTSMAAPHVSGLAALAVSLGWTGASGPDGVVAQLQKAARPLAGLSRDEQGAGEIDAGKLAH